VDRRKRDKEVDNVKEWLESFDKFRAEVAKNKDKQKYVEIVGMAYRSYIGMADAIEEISKVIMEGASGINEEDNREVREFVDNLSNVVAEIIKRFLNDADVDIVGGLVIVSMAYTKIVREAKEELGLIIEKIRRREEGGDVSYV